MSDISDNDNDDFAPLQHKRRRIGASQTVRKQKPSASQRSTPSQTPSRIVQGALLPKASAYQSNCSQIQYEKQNWCQAVKTQPATHPLSASRTPLRSLPAASAGPHAAATAGADKAGGTDRSSEDVSEAPSGVREQHDLPLPDYSPTANYASGAGSVPRLTASAALLSAPGGLWRRLSGPRPPSKLSCRRSGGAASQTVDCLASQAPQQQLQHSRDTHRRSASSAPSMAAALTPPLPAPAGPGAESGGPAEPHCAVSAAACCPVCGCDLALVSDTATGREAHVNACLDSGGAAAVDREDAGAGATVASSSADRAVPCTGQGQGPLKPNGAARHNSDRSCFGQPASNARAEPLVTAVAAAREVAMHCDGSGGGSTAARSARTCWVQDSHEEAMEIELLDSDDERDQKRGPQAPLHAPSIASAAAVTADAATGGAAVRPDAVSREPKAWLAPAGAGFRAGCSGQTSGRGSGCENTTAAYQPELQTGPSQGRAEDAGGVEGDGLSAGKDAADAKAKRCESYGNVDGEDDELLWPPATQVPPLSESPPPRCEFSHDTAHEEDGVPRHRGVDGSAPPGVDRTQCVSTMAAYPSAAAGCALGSLPPATHKSYEINTTRPALQQGADGAPLGSEAAWGLRPEATHAGPTASNRADAGGGRDPDLQCDLDTIQYGDEPQPCGDCLGLYGDEETYETPYPADEAEELAGQGHKAQEEQEDVDEDDPVAAWLHCHGLQRWLPRFRDGEVDEAVVSELSDSDLQGLGIDSPRARAAILVAARTFGTEPPQAPHGCRTSLKQPAAPVGASHAGQDVTADRTAQVHGPLNPKQQQPQQQQPFLQYQYRQPQTKQLLPGEQQPGCGPSERPPPPRAQAQAPASPGTALKAGAAAQPAAPFASMFLAKPSGPVRITSFFRGGGEGTAAGHAQVDGALTAQQRQQQRPHSAFVLEGRAGSQPRQQLQPATRLPQQPNGPQQPQHHQQRRQSQPGGASGGPGGRLPRWVPEAHTIPGTRFLVDYFGPASKNVPAAVSPFRILTHFHADHYKGLTRSFNGGTVLTGPVTARLVSERLKLPAARLRVLPMDTPVEVDGVHLTLVDANHCPGAAMVVAQPPGGWPPVLHTGDCRLGEHMRSHPALQALVGRRCTLVLDTTYCDPQYEFPPQKAVLDAVMEAVKAESFNKRALFVFGTYTIGKERLFLEVAAALGQKVYCSKEKAATLAACGLAPQYASLITTNHLEASIHAVPLFKVTLDGLSSILSQYRGRYNAVIGFSPTGWNHTGGPRGGGGAGGGGRGGGGRGSSGAGGRSGRASGGVLSRQQQSAVIGRRVAKGTAVIYQVPYSEHSSFGELRSFVSWLQPGRIVPSVNADGPAGPKTRRMLQLLLGPEPAAAGPGGSGSGDGPATTGGAGGSASGVSGPPAKRDIRSFMRGSGTVAGASGLAGGG